RRGTWRLPVGLSARGDQQGREGAQGLDSAMGAAGRLSGGVVGSRWTASASAAGGDLLRGRIRKAIQGRSQGDRADEGGEDDPGAGAAAVAKRGNQSARADVRPSRVSLSRSAQSTDRTTHRSKITMASINKPLEEYDSVKTWYRGLREQSGVEPNDDKSRLELLSEFCVTLELDPDEIVAACLLKKEGKETKISIKGRRSMAERITDFQAEGSAAGRERATRGNTIRSFLIHNGILLQSGIQI